MKYKVEVKRPSAVIEALCVENGDDCNACPFNESCKTYSHEGFASCADCGDFDERDLFAPFPNVEVIDEEADPVPVYDDAWLYRQCCRLETQIKDLKVMICREKRA